MSVAIVNDLVGGTEHRDFPQAFTELFVNGKI